MSSGHTQSPSPCAHAGEASAEPEGWCYFDHCTPFSEYTWLISLLPLMDPILNGKSLLERQISTPVMYTTPFPQHPTAPFLVTPNIWGRIRSHREMKLLAPGSKVNPGAQRTPLMPTVHVFQFGLWKFKLPAHRRSRIRALNTNLSTCFLSRWILSERGTFKAWEGCGGFWASLGLVRFKCGLVSSN